MGDGRGCWDHGYQDCETVYGTKEEYTDTAVSSLKKGYNKYKLKNYAQRQGTKMPRHSL
jgi:hypothetical protein